MKTRLLSLTLMLAAPALLAAQQPAPLPPNPLTTMFRTRMVNYQRLLAQAFDSIPESKFGYKPTPALLTKLKTSFKFCEDALVQLDDTKLAEPFEVRQGNNVVNITRAQRVVGHIIDLVDHYSQIAIYMRLNGMLPPTALPRPRP